MTKENLPPFSLPLNKLKTNANPTQLNTITNENTFNNFKCYKSEPNGRIEEEQKRIGNEEDVFHTDGVLSDPDDDNEDVNRVIEESPTGRWNKLDTEIFVQKLIDFDSTHLAIDTEKGYEIAWNEMKYDKMRSPPNGGNRFASAHTVRLVYEKLEKILKFLIKLEHSNLLKFYDYWFVDNERHTKLVVITEYSTGGSLRKLLENSKISQSRVRPPTSKRWLCQILYLIKCLHNDRISLFQGHLSSETIFIQSNGVIKLTPTLLSLNSICQMDDNGLIVCSENVPKLELNKEVMIKDFNALGRLSIEIFTAHVRAPSPAGCRNTRSRSATQQEILLLMFKNKDSLNMDENSLLENLKQIDDEMQKDFVLTCFDSKNVDTIWLHPFINNIYSLKVLSVFSILTYFQECKYGRSSSRNASSNDPNANNNNSNSSTGANNRTTLLIGNVSTSHVCPMPESNDQNPANNATRNSVFDRNGSFSSQNSYSNLAKFRHLSNISNKRKVSLTFLTNYNNLTIPQDFFNILEEIRSGLYPRLFKDILDNQETSRSFRSTPSASYLDFVIRNKQLIDRRRSSMSNFSFSFQLSRDFDQHTEEEEEEEEDDHHPTVFNLTTSSDSELEDSRNGRGSGDECIRRKKISSPTRTNRRQQAKLTRHNSNGKYPVELRRLVCEKCFVKRSDRDSKMIELVLILEFDDHSRRNLSSFFPSEFLDKLRLEREQMKNAPQQDLTPTVLAGVDIYPNVTYERPFETKLRNVCNHLSHELIDNGLINSKDFYLISDLFYRTIEQSLAAATAAGSFI